MGVARSRSPGPEDPAHRIRDPDGTSMTSAGAEALYRPHAGGGG